MANQLHLHARHHRMLEEIWHSTIPDVDIWAYGSRINGRSHDGSDLDLVLRGPELDQIPQKQLTKFVNAVKQSNIPFLVDVRDWARMPQQFQQRVDQEYVVLFRSE